MSADPSPDTPRRKGRAKRPGRSSQQLMPSELELLSWADERVDLLDDPSPSAEADQPEPRLPSPPQQPQPPVSPANAFQFGTPPWPTGEYPAPEVDHLTAPAENDQPEPRGDFTDPLSDAERGEQPQRAAPPFPDAVPYGAAAPPLAQPYAAWPTLYFRLVPCSAPYAGQQDYALAVASPALQLGAMGAYGSAHIAPFDPQHGALVDAPLAQHAPAAPSGEVQRPPLSFDEVFDRLGDVLRHHFRPTTDPCNRLQSSRIVEIIEELYRGKCDKRRKSQMCSAISHIFNSKCRSHGGARCHALVWHTAELLRRG